MLPGRSRPESTFCNGEFTGEKEHSLLGVHEQLVISVPSEPSPERRGARVSIDGALVVETVPDITNGDSGKSPAIAFHSLANIFPLVEGHDFSSLVADIAAHGLREPIITTRDDRIVDGRNRYHACVTAGIEPRIEILDIDDAELLSWVLSRNLHRRHLTTAQRAAIAADLAHLRQGGEQAADLTIALSQAKTAMMLKVSPRSIRSVRAIKDVAPELHRSPSRSAVVGP